MALIKERPHIRVRVPGSVTPGKSFTVTVLLESKSGVDIDWIDVGLEGTEGWSYRSGDNTRTAQREICRLGSRVREGASLAAGTTEIDVRTSLPEDAPTSYKGTSAYIRYVVTVHVSIDWWPDAKASFELMVRRPPEKATPVRGAPKLYSSEATGPRGKEPHIELSLASDVVAVGGQVVGSVAVYNVAHNAYRGISLTLEGREHRTDSAGRARGWSTQRFVHQLALHSTEEAAQSQFRFTIPAVMPTQSSELWRLEWQLSVAAQIKWRSDPMFSVPIRIVSSDTPLSVEGEAPPTVGSDRIAAVWQSVAARHGVRLSDNTMRGQFGQVAIEIFRDHRGQEGAFLCACVRFPNLGLQLDAGPLEGFRRFFGGGVDLGDSPFAAKHYARGREVAQVDSFMRRLLPHLARFAVDDAEDTLIEVSRQDAGHTPESLGAFVRDVAELARMVPHARADIPPPAAMQEFTAAWRKVAERLDTSLDTGCMAARGTLDGVAVEVVTEWAPDGAPSRTRLTVLADPPIESQFVHDGDEFVSGDITKLPGDARALAQALCDGEVMELRVESAHVELTLPAPLSDPKLALEKLRKMLSLIALLRANVGPYR